MKYMLIMRIHVKCGFYLVNSVFFVFLQQSSKDNETKFSLVRAHLEQTRRVTALLLSVLSNWQLI